MNKLEEQLRASRRTEVPGLKPPPGGWEAISGKLGAEAGAGAGGTAAATGGGTAAGATAKAILLKWLTGLGGLLLAASVSVYLLMEAPDNTTVGADTPKTTSEVPLHAGAAPATAAVAAPAGSGESSLPETARPEAKEPPAAKSTPAALPAPLPTGRTAGATAGTTSPDSPARLQNDVRGGKPVPVAESDKNGSASSPDITSNARPSDSPETKPKEDRPAEQSNALGRKATGPEASNNAFNDPYPAPATAPATVPESETAETGNQPPLTRTDGEAALRTVPASTTTEREMTAAPQLAGSPISFLPANLLQTRPAPMVSYHKRRRKKPRARAEWQLHGSSSRFSYEEARSSIYERDPTEQATNIFQLPGGETVYADFLSASNSRNLRKAVRLTAGIDRQTSSGFLFHSSAGIYHSYTEVDDDEVALLPSNQIFVYEDTEEWSIPVELGLHYTFLKRHRFRPYLGVNLFSNLIYSGRYRSSFSDNQTNQTGLVSGRNINRFPSLDLGLSATLGVQYKLTSKWSAGGFLWLGGDNNSFLETPFGLEIRYSLK